MFKVGSSPSESFARLIKMARICSALVGMDVISAKYRMNWVTKLVLINIVGYFFFSVNTIVNLYEENPTFVLEASCTLGSVLQGISKILTGLVYHKTFFELHTELDAIYKEYEKKGFEYQTVLNRSCKRVRNVIKVLGLINIYGITGIMCVPIGFLIATKKRFLIMHFHLPGLDVTTNFGYFITMVSHCICVYVGAFGLYAGDLIVVIYLLQSLLFADIFKLKIQELNTCLEISGNVKKKVALLRDIISWHKKYNRFNTLCNEIMYYVITVQITTSGISIVCTLFVLLTGEWPGGYGYLLLPIVSLYSYCMLGTRIEICNDRFSHELYDINWFMLPQKEQELVGFMLMKSQAPATVDVAGVMPLSVATALQITKSIYSIFMMMLQTLAK